MQQIAGMQCIDQSQEIISQHRSTAYHGLYCRPGIWSKLLFWRKQHKASAAVAAGQDDDATQEHQGGIVHGGGSIAHAVGGATKSDNLREVLGDDVTLMRVVNELIPRKVGAVQLPACCADRHATTTALLRLQAHIDSSNIATVVLYRPYKYCQVIYCASFPPLALINL